MAEVVLFHHMLGLTAGVHAFADELRGAGHTVHTPDVYDGKTFTTLADGETFVKQLGFDTALQRGVDAVEGLPDELVYVGMSLGVMPAQQLTQNRPGAVAAVLLHGCVPPSEFGTWPAGVPAQIHGMDHDPYFAEEGGDIDAARAMAAEIDGVELFVYPGDQHLFSDRSLDSYDEAAAKLLTERVLAFLAGR